MDDEEALANVDDNVLLWKWGPVADPAPWFLKRYLTLDQQRTVAAMQLDLGLAMNEGQRRILEETKEMLKLKR